MHIMMIYAYVFTPLHLAFQTFSHLVFRVVCDTVSYARGQIHLQCWRSFPPWPLGRGGDGKPSNGLLQTMGGMLISRSALAFRPRIVMLILRVPRWGAHGPTGERDVTSERQALASACYFKALEERRSVFYQGPGTI
jgi:hypothetical protein